MNAQRTRLFRNLLNTMSPPSQVPVRMLPLHKDSEMDVDDDDDNDEHQLNIDESKHHETALDDHDPNSSDDEQVGAFVLCRGRHATRDALTIDCTLTIDQIEFLENLIRSSMN
jgi:hypothetical protein